MGSPHGTPTFDDLVEVATNDWNRRTWWGKLKLAPLLPVGVLVWMCIWPFSQAGKLLEKIGEAMPPTFKEDYSDE